MNTDSSSDEQSIPVVPHDDGIFSHPNELSFGATHITEFAKEVIASYRETEYEKVKGLKAPSKSIKGVPDHILLKQIKDGAGKITFAPTQLSSSTTKEEHLFPQCSFYLHAEPVYPNQKSVHEHHPAYCWKVALLNAYRVLDLRGDESQPFPHGWISPQVTPDDERYPTLLASAAYQMGLYYAKALALQKAPAAIKGKKMTTPNKGRYKPLGRTIYPACKELEKKIGGELPRHGVSKMLMDHLEAQNLASTKTNPWKIFTEEGEEAVDSKQLGRYIARYRKRNEV